MNEIQVMLYCLSNTAQSKEVKNVVTSVFRRLHQPVRFVNKFYRPFSGLILFCPVYVILRELQTGNHVRSSVIATKRSLFDLKL